MLCLHFIIFLMELGSDSCTFLTVIWNSAGDIPSCNFAIVNVFVDFMNFSYCEVSLEHAKGKFWRQKDRMYLFLSKNDTYIPCPQGSVLMKLKEILNGRWNMF